MMLYDVVCCYPSPPGALWLREGPVTLEERGQWLFQCSPVSGSQGPRPFQGSPRVGAGAFLEAGREGAAHSWRLLGPGGPVAPPKSPSALRRERRSGEVRD